MTDHLPENQPRGLRCPEWVTTDSLNAARDHFNEVHPHEGVGFLTADGFVAIRNTADEPERYFTVADEDWLRHAPVLAVLHSHPGGKGRPSSADMKHQIATAVPWAIIVTDGTHAGDPVWFGDQLAVPSLYGRQFLHGITDCYSLIRDCYRLGQEALATLPEPHQRIHHWPYPPVTLKEHPRDDDWWNTEENLYEQGFAATGFRKIDPRLIRTGDIFLAQLGRAKAINHGGIYVGNGLVLHHVNGYTSQRAPLNIWAHSAKLWLRYQG